MTVLTVVVFDDRACRRAACVYAGLPPTGEPQPPPHDDSATVDIEGMMNRMLWLVDKVTGDRWFATRVLPQLHVLLWGNRRGV